MCPIYTYESLIPVIFFHRRTTKPICDESLMDDVGESPILIDILVTLYIHQSGPFTIDRIKLTKP